MDFDEETLNRLRVVAGKIGQRLVGDRDTVTNDVTVKAVIAAGKKADMEAYQAKSGKPWPIPVSDAGPCNDCGAPLVCEPRTLEMKHPESIFCCVPCLMQRVKGGQA